MRRFLKWLAVFFFAILGCLVLLFGGLAIYDSTQPPITRAQYTLYVAPPLLLTGGTVIVTAKEIPLEQWRDLPDGPNPAREDAANAKRDELKAGDRLFGAEISMPVSIVEIVYPQGGTYGFNLVAASGAPDDVPALESRRIGVGRGSFVMPESGERIEWPSVSTIHIAGPEVSEGDSRLVRHDSADLMRQRPPARHYEGAIVYEPTPEQIARTTKSDPQ